MRQDQNAGALRREGATQKRSTARSNVLPTLPAGWAVRSPFLSRQTSDQRAIQFYRLAFKQAKATLSKQWRVTRCWRLRLKLQHGVKCLRGTQQVAAKNRVKTMFRKPLAESGCLRASTSVEAGATLALAQLCKIVIRFSMAHNKHARH